jgi:chromosome segregation ATPase
MAYVRGKSEQPSTTVLNVEQARRRNAELRLELAGLMAEQSDLAAKVEAMRAEVTAARKKLSRQIRDVDAVRAQAARIASIVERESTLPAPVYGGREGLQAAADEIEAYESKPGAKLGTVRRSNPRHGTGRKYGTGCRCGDCLGWRDRKSAREVVLKAARMERRIAEAVAARAA